MSEPLQPPPSVLVKLGSIAVHTEEMIGPGGHHFDLATIKALLYDPEVQAWRAEMAAMALLPEKRASS